MRALWRGVCNICGVSIPRTLLPWEAGSGFWAHLWNALDRAPWAAWRRADGLAMTNERTQTDTHDRNVLSGLIRWLAGWFSSPKNENFSHIQVDPPAWTKRKYCKICDRLIPLERLKRWPRAALCGHEQCAVKNQRRRHTKQQQTWRRKRMLLEPGWQDEMNKKQRDRYIPRRAREGSAKGQVPESAPGRAGGG